MNEAWEPADINDSLAYRIKKSIYCEVTEAVRKHGTFQYKLRGKPAQALPDNWGVQMTLTLTVDETSSLNPSASITRNIHAARDVLAPSGSVAQSFALPFTAQLSTQAVRIDTYYSFFTVHSLTHPPAPPKKDTSCHELDANTGNFGPLDRSGSSYLLSGNVGIEGWLVNALEENNALPSSSLPNSKVDVLQYSIKFSVITSGTVNPAWKLAPVSTAVGGMPLFSANRTRTHQLLLTLGPSGSAAETLHSNGQFEQAASNAFRSALGR